MTQGISPNNVKGFALPDGNWLAGLAGGVNFSYQDGITATAGGTKAAAFQLPAGVFLLEVDTVATAADSVLLPKAEPGTAVLVFNSGANSMDAYGQGTDTINNAATANAYAIAANAAVLFACAKAGSWAAVKTA